MDATERHKVDYSSDRIMTDPEFRRKLMADICRWARCCCSCPGGEP